MPAYTLPDLSYDHGALEPHISGKIMELHHGEHHAAYVKGANETFDRLADARQRNEFSSLAGLERALAFNVSGHILHSLFWRNLSPDGGDAPSGDLAKAIDRDFGDFDAFKRQLNAAAASIMGSGWAALMWDPVYCGLLITTIHDHQSETIQSGTPLLVLDAWEHAYYLQYQNRKADYFAAIWNVFDWNEVADRYVASSTVDIGSPHFVGEAEEYATDEMPRGA
jgi:Fe-Mn family superoxide dismutase